MALTLFKNITQELTEHEKTVLVPMLMSTLANTHTGNRFTGRELCGWFGACGEAVSGVRLRKMVNYIRTMNLLQPYVLIGAGNGYFITQDVHTVEQQIESLQGRVDAMLAAVDSIKAQKQNLIRNKTALAG